MLGRRDLVAPLLGRPAVAFLLEAAVDEHVGQLGAGILLVGGGQGLPELGERDVGVVRPGGHSCLRAKCR
jgi:hypothetical protein